MKELVSQKPSFLRTPRLIIASLLVVAVLCVFSVGADKTVIYFYSSETTINNFKSLKMEFDRYLSKIGPYEFQPFSSRATFERHIKGRENCLVLLSSWHYRHIHKQYALTPALMGLRKGKKYQKRVLVCAEKAMQIEALKSARLASASNLQHTTSVLKAMLKGKYAEKLFRILTVPKDIDALMSVGFGMSKMALTTGNCLEELKQVNPNLCKKMSVVAEGEESFLMILAVPRGFAEEAQKMVNAIQEMSADPDGKRKIRMLGLDGWQRFDPSDKSRLES
jgi:hypothetical protein